MSSRGRYDSDNQAYPGSSSPRGLPGRNVRPQRSMADVSTRPSGNRRGWSSNSPSLPSSPLIDHYPRGSESSTSSKSSFSSNSSRGSSTFSSRERAYESSTSIDEPTSKPSGRVWTSLSERRQRPSKLTGDNANQLPNDGGVTQWESRRPSHLRNTVDDISAGNGKEEQIKDQSTAEGYGGFLWNRISSAANTLTINVSKAWAVGIFTDDGEVTPPGGETRLTRALKSYHLNKARATTDLPPWLFTEEERRATRGKVTSSREDDSWSSDREPQESRPKGLKGIYADLDADASMNDSAYRYDRHDPGRADRQRKTTRSGFDGPSERYEAYSGISVDSGSDQYQAQSQSKAISRLQAMRDARRPNNKDDHLSLETTGERNRDWGSMEVGRVAPGRRVGLPTGPKQR